MKAKNFSNKAYWQSISGRKKIIIFFSVIFLFFAINHVAKAQSCSSVGGACTSGTSRVCPSGYEYQGLYDCPDSAPNCCKQSSSTTGGGNQTSGFGNPLSVDTIEKVLENIWGYLSKIAGTIAVIFIIIGGVMYMMSIGNKEMLERAKKTLIFAIAGLAIVVAAPLFYKEIKAIFEGGSPGSALQQVLANVLKLLLSIVGFLAIITMIIGSIWMFSAVGDEERYKMGRKTVAYSIVGITIAVAALIIVNQVIALIGG